MNKIIGFFFQKDSKAPAFVRNGYFVFLLVVIGGLASDFSWPDITLPSMPSFEAPRRTQSIISESEIPHRTGSESQFIVNQPLEATLTVRERLERDAPFKLQKIATTKNPISSVLNPVGNVPSFQDNLKGELFGDSLGKDGYSTHHIQFDIPSHINRFENDLNESNQALYKKILKDIDTVKGKGEWDQLRYVNDYVNQFYKPESLSQYVQYFRAETHNQ